MPDPNTTAVATPPSEAVPSAPVTPDSGAGSPAAAPVTPEPFLAIPGTRQVYKTREEAERAYGESANRISELSPWEKLAKEGFNADQVAEYLDELARLRAAAAQPPSPTQANASNAEAALGGDKDAFNALPKEWQDHVKFLLPVLDKLGFVRKDALSPIQEQVQTLTQSQQGEQTARVSAARNNGIEIINGFVKEAGLAVDEKGLARIIRSIESEIVEASRNEQGQLITGSPEDRFIKSNSAERSTMLREYFNWFTQFGDLYAKRQTATLVDQKAAAQAASQRPLPASSSPVPTPAVPGKGFKDPGLNARVTAAMEAERARRGGGPLL